MCDDGGYLFCGFHKDSIAGSSSGPVALFWLRFCNCLIIPFVPTVLDLFLDCHQFGCLHNICRKFPML